MVGIVAEGYVVKVDLTVQGDGLETVGIVGDDGVGVEDFADALDAYGNLGDGVGGGGEIFYGLEEFGEIGEIDGEFADGHGVGDNQAAPRQSTMAVQIATVMLTTGESSALMLRALSAAVTVASLTIIEQVFFRLLLAEGFDDLHGFEPLLGDGDDLALFFADFLGCGFD